MKAHMRHPQVASLAGSRKASQGYTHPALRSQGNHSIDVPLPLIEACATKKPIIRDGITYLPANVDLDAAKKLFE
jgi:hypothetical protein